MTTKPVQALTSLQVKILIWCMLSVKYSLLIASTDSKLWEKREVYRGSNKTMLHFLGFTLLLLEVFSEE